MVAEVKHNNIIITLMPDLYLKWSPETTLQAEDRFHRPGHAREVQVHYLLSSHTVDQQVWDLVDQK